MHGHELSHGIGLSSALDSGHNLARPAIHTASDALRADFLGSAPGKSSDVPKQVASNDAHPTALTIADSPAATPQGDTKPAAVAPTSDAAPEAPAAAAPQGFEMPAPIQQALDSGKPVSFSSSGENAAANRQPDYYLTPEGKLVKNENAQPSSDGSINVEIQTQKPEDNKSLRDAITHQTEMQKAAAKEMIRLFQKNNPGKAVPGWMNDLANAKPNIPDFAPVSTNSRTPSAPPENGFVNRGAHGAAGFANNGGFDGNGNFRGNGSPGDGSMYSGATDNRGQPLGPGEQVQAKAIYDYLTTHHGLQPHIASGILGNMMTESSLKTHAYNRAEGAIGLIQWEGPRRTALEQFASHEGKPVTDWHVQVDFMMHELKTTESGAFARLQHAQTPAQAAAIFDQYFERSAGTSRGQRMANAENIHQTVAQTVAQAPAQTNPKA